jgi:hypothetical protein
MVTRQHPIFATLARVAKLVDALSSGGSIRKVVLVRIQSRAQDQKAPNYWSFFIFTSENFFVLKKSFFLEIRTIDLLAV